MKKFLFLSSILVILLSSCNSKINEFTAVLDNGKVISFLDDKGHDIFMAGDSVVIEHYIVTDTTYTKYGPYQHYSIYGFATNKATPQNEYNDEYISTYHKAYILKD